MQKIRLFITPALPSLREQIDNAIAYWTCWHTLSRLTSEKLYKTGLASVFLVPMIASVCMTLHLPDFFPRQSVWLFFSGIAVIAANIIYALRCPVVVKEQLHRQRYQSYRPWPLEYLRDELLTALSLKLLRIEYTEEDLVWLKIRRERYYQSSVELIEAGYPCVVIGYSARGVFEIEDLLLKAAIASGNDLYIKYPGDKDYQLSTLAKLTFPRYSWLPGNGRELVEFEFSPHRPLELNIGREDDFFCSGGGRNAVCP
jgi:hypothetical protein